MHLTHTDAYDLPESKTKLFPSAVTVAKSPYHSSAASQDSFSRAHLYNRWRPESCDSSLRRGQTRRNLTEDLLVVSGCRPLHMNTSARYACFLRQPFELTLKKDFQLLRGQDGNGNSRGLAGLGLNPHAIWGLELLCFRSHTTPLFWNDESGRQDP